MTTATARSPKVAHSVFRGHGLDPEHVLMLAETRAQKAGRVPTGEEAEIREHVIADGWEITVVSLLCENNAPPPRSTAQMGYIKQVRRVSIKKKRAGAT